MTNMKHSSRLRGLHLNNHSEIVVEAAPSQLGLNVKNHSEVAL